MIRNFLSRTTVGSAVFGLVTSVSMILAGGHSTSVDEETYLASLRGFLHGRSDLDLTSVSISSISAVTGRHGTLTSYYGFGTILFNLPMYLIGKFFSLFVGIDSKEQVLRLFFYFTNSFALGLTALAILKICSMLGLSLRLSVWASLTFSFSTFALAMAGGGFAEPITSMFLVWAVYFCFHNEQTRQRMTLCGLMIGCSVLMRPSSILFVPIIGVYLMVITGSLSRLRKIAFLAAGGAWPLIIFFAVNYWRFGGILKTGYPTNIPFTTPIYEGLFGLFLSPGKGLAWYAPITIVALATIPSAVRNNKPAALFLWSCIGANALFFGRYEVWNGDVAFGPRYMAIVLPLIAVAAAVGAQRFKWELLIATIVGLPASLGGALVYFNAANWAHVPTMAKIPGAKLADGTYDWITLRAWGWFVPRYSGLVVHVEYLDDAVRNTWDRVRGANAPNLFAHGNRHSLGWYSRTVRLDMWWTYWLESPASRIFVLGVPVLIAVSVFCTVRLWRTMKINGDGASTSLR